MRRIWRVLAAVGLMAGIVTSPVLSAPAGAAPVGGRFRIVEFQFSPASRTIVAGQRIKWTNQGSFSHTATSDTPGAFDSGVLAPGASFGSVFPTAGTFTFHCAIHPSMTGTVIVNPAQAG